MLAQINISTCLRLFEIGARQQQTIFLLTNSQAFSKLQISRWEINGWHFLCAIHRAYSFAMKNVAPTPILFFHESQSSCFRGLVEVVRSIQDQLVQLKDANRNLIRRLDEESTARRRLENTLRNNNVIHTVDSD